MNIVPGQKMPKRVEMVRTKCQPKKKSGQNADVLVGISSVGILSAHPPSWPAGSANHPKFQT